jgi:hypothetical protein
MKPVVRDKNNGTIQFLKATFMRFPCTLLINTEQYALGIALSIRYPIRSRGLAWTFAEGLLRGIAGQTSAFYNSEISTSVGSTTVENPLHRLVCTGLMRKSLRTYSERIDAPHRSENREVTEPPGEGFK